MLDIGWQELFLVAIITLIVVGPKDLPTVLRTVARGVARMRQLSAEFQSGLSQIVRDAELDDLKRKAETIARSDVAGVVKKTVDPGGTLTAEFDPEDFNRRLMERVRSGPPEGPMLTQDDGSGGHPTVPHVHETDVPAQQPPDPPHSTPRDTQ